MKLIIASIATIAIVTSCATTKVKDQYIDQVVDVACGMCLFEMTGDDCALAVKIDGKYYYVEGSSIDEHGDAHAEDGLCTVVRKAQVKGYIKHGVFVADSIKLIE